MPDPNPALQETGANPAWKESFGTEAASALESFKEPTDFLKSYQDMSGELKTLKEKPVHDWRKEAAGEDEKTYKLLERFSTAKDFGKAYYEAQAKIRSGELTKPLPDGATPEQIAAYRAERGIPEKPEGYLEKLPNGLVIGKDDLPIFQSLATKLHERNADPQIVHSIVDWYNNFREETAAEQAESDAAHKTEVEDALRTEWAGDYRANVNHVKAFLDGAPQGVAERIANARDSDGRALLNDPAVLKWLAGTAREINPIHTIVPGSGGNDIQTVEAELGKLNKLMGNQNSEYWKGPNADKNQKRYRELIEAQQRIKKRNAA